MPVQVAERCKESRTNSGMMAVRTPSTANPSAKATAATAR
jgi:hypothetical protein